MITGISDGTNEQVLHGAPSFAAVIMITGISDGTNEKVHLILEYKRGLQMIRVNVLFSNNSNDL